MIKLIIFDLDGCLVDARDLHYKALNGALCEIDNKYYINKEEHLAVYDGLPTKKKLALISKNKGLPVNQEIYNKIWELKQKETIKIIKNDMSYDNRMRCILENLKQDGYKICVASNSIRESLKMMLIKKGLLEYIDFYLSNEDVKNPKPNAEIYMRCMIIAGVNPKETLIIEDSHIGRTGANNSGSFLHAVRDPDDVNYNRIKQRILQINKLNSFRPKWEGGKMNVLIPMAGAGSRFQQAGYTFPKPLIEVEGKPMIQLVVENLNIEGHHIFIVLKEHYEKYNLKYLLNLVAPNCEIIQVDGITEGACCTTLLAKELINNSEPLLIANSDQYIEWDSNEFMYSMVGDNVDGGILTFKSTHPKWSYAKLGDDGFVVEVAEKVPISDKATAGIYFWAKGSEYVKYAERMIKLNKRVNNEFYVCPVFNEAIQDNKKIKVFEIEKMWGIGTPEDLETYLRRIS